MEVANRIAPVFNMSQKTRKDLCDWIVEALKDLNGSAQIRQVREHIWKHHSDEITSSGGLHFTWN